jgi:chromosomal replication initiation ATPase DnaA
MRSKNDTGLFQPYDTKIESDYIVQYIIKNKSILNLSKIACLCGMERHTLVKLSKGQLQTLSEKNILPLSNILKELEFEIPIRVITIETIQQKISKVSRVSLKEMKLKHRRQPATEERQIIMYLCKELLKRTSLKKIGEHFEAGKTHVYNSWKTIKIQLEVDCHLRKKVDNYIKLLKNVD